jgi:hypothetical protein
LHIQGPCRYKAIQFSYTSGISLYTAIGTITAATAATSDTGNDGSTSNDGNDGSTSNGNGNDGSTARPATGNGNGGSTARPATVATTGSDGSIEHWCRCNDGIAFSHTGFPLGLSCPLPKIFQFFKLSVQ